jgi:hypothetical protein
VCDRGQGEHFEVGLARVLTTRREAAPLLVRESEAFAVAKRETALSVRVGFMSGAG